MAILKLCARCKKVIQYPNRYCEDCKKIVNKQIEENKKKWNKEYNKRRNPKYAKFYNSHEWKDLKNEYLKDHKYQCEKCKEKKKKDPKYIMQIAKEVHHKEPIQTPEGWSKRFDYYGLEALCHDCHNEEHKRFQKKEVSK